MSRRLVYVPVVSGEEVRLRARPVQVARGASEMTQTLQVLLDQKVAGRRLFPPGTRALGCTVGKDGVAVVDLSAEARSFQGGSAEEAAAVNAIALTAAQFDGVKQVRITCTGAELETLAGHLDLTVPVQPDYSLVQK